MLPRMQMRLSLFNPCQLLIIILLAACSNYQIKDQGTPEGLFEYAEQLEKDDRYEEAIQKFQEVKNKHPYSKLATAAELRVADIYYKRETFIEAQAAYQIFKELHPRHPSADYVTFRLGMSYFMQLPSTIDRDLGQAHKAILYFEELARAYPQSQHVEEAAKKRGEARRMLADKELYIADFYLKREHFQSALPRYEKVLTLYPTEGVEPKALVGAGVAAARAGDLDKGGKY
ncbi:MAG: outer membrane protein assembly factor BamD, partial [Bdellovibrionales bacterium]|nr:outer membrane protein assembly factor BamD [Bdellovibrionales bacterium]